MPASSAPAPISPPGSRRSGCLQHGKGEGDGGHHGEDLAAGQGLDVDGGALGVALGAVGGGGHGDAEALAGVDEGGVAGEGLQLGGLVGELGLEVGDLGLVTLELGVLCAPCQLGLFCVIPMETRFFIPRELTRAVVFWASACSLASLAMVLQAALVSREEQ